MSRQPVFSPKEVNCWNFEYDCLPNGIIGNVAARRVSIYFFRYGVLGKNFFNKSHCYKLKLLPYDNNIVNINLFYS